MEKELQNLSHGVEKLIDGTNDDLFKIIVEKVVVEFKSENSGGPIYPNNNQNGMGNICSPQP